MIEYQGLLKGYRLKSIKWLLPILAIALSACNKSSSSSSSEDISSVSLSSQTSSLISSVVSSSGSTSSSSIASSSSATSIPSSSSSPATSQDNEPIVFPTISVTSNAPNYYNSISESLTGNSLKSALLNVINKNVSVSYNWDRYEHADQDLTNTNHVLTIYARVTYPKSSQLGSTQIPNYWNREHTFPKSKISGAAESDNHHIFADDWKTNKDRGNKLFAELTTSNANWVVDSGGRTTQNLTNSTYFEPNDAAKGEVARATLYMNTMYGYSLNGNFQTAELAVLWALYYPVTDWAMIRNNRVYERQNNRNPYIDNQAYTCKVYGNTTTRTAQLCANYL